MTRIDREGRDVTELPGLWSEDDLTYARIQPEELNQSPRLCFKFGDCLYWQHNPKFKFAFQLRRAYLAGNLREIIG